MSVRVTAKNPIISGPSPQASVARIRIASASPVTAGGPRACLPNLSAGRKDPAARSAQRGPDMSEDDLGGKPWKLRWEQSRPEPVDSCCGFVGWGAACIFGDIQHPGALAYWILGERRAPWAAFCRKRALLEALGLRIGAFGAVLCARSRVRGLRDADNSGICTALPGVPAGKRRPPRHNIHSAGRFMQKGGCEHAIACNSLEPESRSRLLGALEGADHVDLVESAIGSEVDDKRKAKGKHHGEHVA